MPHGGPLVVGIGMVKNEQDIIEPFVRHNLRFVDVLVLLDNGSVDATRDILSSLVHETGRVVVGDVPQFGYHQPARLTRLLHAVQSAFFADYIVPLDADEFIRADDRSTFLAALARIPPACLGLMHWQTVLPSPDAGEAADPPRSLERRRVREQPDYAKAVLRIDGAVGSDLQIRRGAHGFIRNGEAIPPSLGLQPVTLVHAPIRSAAQLASKSVIGWVSFLAEMPTARQTTDGYHLRKVFDEIAAARPIGHDDVVRLALGYAQDTTPAEWREATVQDEGGWTYARRYSDGRPLDPLALLARSWEQAYAAGAATPALTRPSSVAGGADRPTGVFADAWHWDNLFVDEPPIRFIVDRLRPSSMLDIGCGVGAYLALAARYGVAECCGVDGLDLSATILGPTQYVRHELTTQLDLGRRFDLVTCLEVAEHLPPGHEDTLLDSIERHAGAAILFSAAEPDQPGHGHVNNRPLSFWLAKWRQRGWLPELVDTLGMRSMATLSWLRRNPVLLRRATDVTWDGTSRLEAIAARPFRWWAQQPGIRATPLDEPPAEPDAGYV